MHRKTEKKLGQKFVLSLAIAAVIAELININRNIIGEMPIINILSELSILCFGIYIWYKLVIEKDRKKYKHKVESIQNRIKLIDFDNIYNKLRKEHREYLEKKRISIRNRLLVRYVGIALISTSIVFGVFDLITNGLGNGKGCLAIGVLGVIAFLGSLIDEQEKEMEYRVAYKIRIISNLLKTINSKLTYRIANDDDELLLSEYEYANFGLMPYTTLEYIDRIEGNIDGNRLDILEMRLEEDVTDENGKGFNFEVFNGMLAKVQTAREGTFKLKVSSVGIHTRAGIYEQGCRKIKLDNSVFMENFVVQTNEKILATRILTSDVMAMLLDYKVKYGIDLDIAIKDGNIYFLFYTGDMFEPDALRDSMNKEELLIDYSTLKMVIELMQKIGAIITEL
ncbi:MAG: DUF3137 domain-containing protein [Clostridia bacterium]|nr:DUF3137 domain-containing protein [Clostridia bacterium]